MISTPPFKGYVEFAPGFTGRQHITHVLFDFDGTLSLIREGWPEVMVPMFVELIPKRAGDTLESLKGMLFDDIMRLNGKQTIYQMIQFAERVKERGEVPREPLCYKNEYLRRLEVRIAGRIEALREGKQRADDFLVFGARALLDDLRRRGLTLYLASGTDERFVRREAEMLEISHYFGSNIYGAQDDYRKFSKKMVIERLLQENQIAGEQLLSFGDGYVEIENTKEAGGLAVAVASDEARNGSGQVDAWKRQRLLGAGADVVIPDFRDSVSLMEVLLDSPPHR